MEGTVGTKKSYHADRISLYFTLEMIARAGLLENYTVKRSRRLSEGLCVDFFWSSRPTTALIKSL